MKNNLRNLRSEKGLTQAQLAEMAALSQQQIQRVEAGVHAVRIDIAASIATALGVNLGTIFPELSEASPGLARRKNLDYPTLYSERNKAALENSGFEADPDYWILRLSLVGGQILDYPINSRAKARLNNLAAGAPQNAFTANQFFCFDSTDHTVCCQLSAVEWFQLRWERADIGAYMANENDRSNSESEEPHRIRIFFRGNTQPIDFEVEPDSAEEANQEEPDYLPLTDLVYALDDYPDSDAQVSFLDDAGGERVFLNPEMISLVEIPLPVGDQDEFE